MKMFWAVFHARNKEFIRDRGSLAWSLLFPILVIFGFGFMFRSGDETMFKVAVHPSIAVAEKAAGTEFLKTKHVRFIEASEVQGTVEKLKRHQVDMLVSFEPNDAAAVQKYWINSTSPKGYLLERLLWSSNGNAKVAAVKQTVEGREIRYVDWLIAGLLGMNMMFGALFGVGYVIVRYRKMGVLRRLKATPLRAFTFLSAQVASRYVLMITMTSVVYLGSHAVLKFQMLGSYFDLFVVMSMGSICLIAMGLLIAARISNEEFAGGLLNLLSWPMMFLSGVWFSLEGAHPWVKKFAMLFPLTHVIDASRAIMTEGASLMAVSGHLVALAAMTILFMTVGAASFKWE